MRLLKKSTLNIELASQKKQQIDSGIAIAKKVDALRQTLGSLQQQQTLFIAGMEDELKRQTDGLLMEIASRKLEIIQLTEKRKQLLEPLTIEWEKVRIAQEVNEETRDVLAKGLLKLSDKQKLAEEKYLDSKKTLARINVRERELNKAIEKAEQNSVETEKIKEDCLFKMSQIDLYITNKTQEFRTMEAELKSKERDVEISAQKIVDDREEIINIKAQLADQRKTLERALARTK